MRKKVTAIATRLNYFMALHAINGANLARGTKIQPSTINKILNNKITDPRISTIQALSSFFGVTTEEFLKESTKMEVQTELLYPLIDFASRWPVLENMVAPRFKVEYYGEDMAPFFTNGSVLEFDKTIQAKNKDFVLALINSGLEKPVVVFRRYLDGATEKYLEPMNSQFKSIALTQEDQILGVLVESYNKFL